MVASSLCRVVATACARRPATWVTFKSAVIVRHPLHQIRMHSHHRQFLRPTTASSAPRPAVTEQPDRPSQTPEDGKEVVSLPRRLTRTNPLNMTAMAKKWQNLRRATRKALRCLTDTNKSQKHREKAIQVLARSYGMIWHFHTNIKRHTIEYRDFAVCRSAAVDVTKSAVRAREALEEAQVKFDEAQMDLDLAQAQAADAQHVELKAEHVRNRKAALLAREKEFREADEAILVSSGISLNIPFPKQCRQAEIKGQDYEWMLGAIDEIQKYRDMLLTNIKQRPAASVVADKLNRSRKAGTKTAATPVEQSGNKEIEQLIEEEDEAGQDVDMESIREQPAPIQEYEDKPERVQTLESSKPYQRPTIRLTEATAISKKPIQLKDSLADHYPIISFPFKVTTTVMLTLHKLFEECCYQFALVHIPHHLAEQNWDCPEAVELSTWHKIFSELLQTDADHVFAFDTGSTFETTVPASRRVIYVNNHLFTLKDIRNQAVHPRPLNPMALPKILRRAGELARLFRDRRLQQDIERLSSEINRVLTAVKTRRAESLKKGRTYELYRQIVADKVAIQRVRNLLADRQVSASSEEHWAACTMFEKDIESLLEALQVAIQADEEARLEAELPPLVEMAEKMAAEVEKRNAEMQLRLEAVRKSRADMVLRKMQFLLSKHAWRMKTDRFPFMNLSERKRELGGVGSSPLPSADEQGGPQEKLEPYERQGHREQPDEKTGFGPPGLTKSSYAYRSIIRNALTQDLRREERELEREQANADVDAHANVTSMSADVERFRLGSVSSLPGEEEWYDEAMSESESGDWGPDGYHMTTSGFFEMLEKRKRLPLEDSKQRAMKEMAAAAVKATKAEQEGEKEEEQVDAGERPRTTAADEIMFNSLMDKYEALCEEVLVKNDMSRRIAFEKKCVRQRKTMESKMKPLRDERIMILKEMKVLKEKNGRLKMEMEKAREVKHQQVGKNEEVDDNKNELEPATAAAAAAAVDKVVDNEAALNMGIKALTELAIKEKENAGKLEILSARKGRIKKVLKKLRGLDPARSVTSVKIGHTEEAANDDHPSSHVEVTDADVDTSMELTEAEAEGWRSSIEEAVDADIMGASSFENPKQAAMEAFLAMEEILEEAMPDVTTGPEASDEVTPAGEVATSKASIVEPSDTETFSSSTAVSADPETVAPPEDSAEEAAMSSDLNDTIIQNAVLESTPVQDAPEEEATTQEMPSDEKTPSLFVPTPRPPRGRSLTNLALYVSRRTQPVVGVTEDLKHELEEDLDEGVKEVVKEDVKQELNEDIVEDSKEDLEEDLNEYLEEGPKDDVKEDLQEDLKDELTDELTRDLEGDLKDKPNEDMKPEAETKDVNKEEEAASQAREK
ncbi:hypothetical protein NCU05695 [Neurospora crassa OR74A]|uniref:Uncharacterized protein n=1 Tax=Neurospora crassa (strain ATCC 24698 / 74-OR23-1A / CBS 708.71 / DSM 1257 / FGSC 987) TaxID=367110 RepID=Q7SBP3_NEUCR|nr:hypothetical protein NCU05695 [Neurospora crassa OR74A]EAA33821.1 hypothetical protein NCU05695 [Neurospora crassa OR74A]|eukprot:XP_963057.1 hypothetical protein NCU05695 [Neurospora crassa OR74A]